MAPAPPARFRVYTFACTAFLLLLLWGGLALQLSFDKAQTTYHASLNVANLSRVLDEKLTGLISEIEQALLFAKHEYEKDPATFDLERLTIPGLWPDGGLSRIEIVDAAGHAVSIRGAGNRTGISESPASIAAHAASRDDRLVIGKPIRVSRQGETRWGIPLSLRLNHVDGSFAGVALATIDAAFLSAIFDQVNIGRDGFIALVGRDDFGVRAWVTEAGAIAPPEDLKRTPLPEAVAAAPAGAFLEASPADGNSRIVGYRSLRRYPMIIEIGASKAELLGAYFIRRSQLILGAALISAVILGAALLLVRQDERRRLAEAALGRQTNALHASRREAELANAAAQKADRAKSEFLANMSHELRTPLNAIIGFSEIMSAAMLGPISEKYRDYAQSIHFASSHLLKIINDILDLAKVEAGRLELQEEEVRVEDVFDSCQRIIAERATGARLTLSFEPTSLRLRADPLRLKQMLLNLLSNAVKFTPAGGQIVTLAALSASGGVSISVRDTGIGIKPEDIEQVLQPFGQINDGSIHASEGTGLGLPLVRRLAELHSGQMALNSRPNEGTTVTLIFPPARTLPHRTEAPVAVPTPAE